MICAVLCCLPSEPGYGNQEVLEQASEVLKDKYGIHQTTLQVENYSEVMEECCTCQSTNKPPPRQLSSLLFWQNAGSNSTQAS